MKTKTMATLTAALICAATPALGVAKAAASKPMPAMPAIPALNATCPAGMTIATDGAGAVRIDGKTVKPRRISDKAVTAAAKGGTVVSLSVGDNGQPVISTTSRGGIHANCVLEESAPVAADAPAAATSPAKAAPSTPSIAPALRASYCRSEVAGRLSTKPEYVSMDRPIAEPGGGTHVDGTVALGSEGKKAFSCQFDDAGHWVELRLP